MDMLEAITEEVPEVKAFKRKKEPEYVMKIISTWMTLEDLDRADIRREYKGRDGHYLVRKFKYRKPFWLSLSLPTPGR